MQRKLLCRSIAGNRCDLLTITNPAVNIEELHSRVVVIFTARVHPGESNASWIMQGLLDFLVGNSIEANTLRQYFIFKIIPMLNPDGVINGNYRCNLSGVDLNRRWSNPDKQKHPTIYYTKLLIRHIKRTYTIGLLVDIHGHSLKKGVFFYGCIPDKKLLRPVSPPITVLIPATPPSTRDSKLNGSTHSLTTDSSREGKKGRFIMFFISLLTLFCMYCMLCNELLYVR